MKRRRVSRNVRVLLACAGLLVAAGGCQPAGEPARIAVFGTVTSESGDPVSGMISFLPEAGTEGPAATASLVDGVFQFDTNNGPVAGRYRVLVVMQSSDQKFKGAAESEAQGTPPAGPPDAEWSFSEEVSPEDVEFNFQVPDEPTAVTRG
ncbi:MAG: hypothetical protein ACM3U2_00385 [Deltaproteobacteria bacterium]